MSDYCKHKQVADHCVMCREEEAAARLKQLRREHEGQRPAVNIGDVARQLQEINLRLGSIDQGLVGIRNMMTLLMSK